MTDIPIIFSAPMIRALIEGRKTMTRRLAWRLKDVGDNHTRVSTPWQKVKPGDRLWIREAWSGPYANRNLTPSRLAQFADEVPVWYWADGNPRDGDWSVPRPSIHMPRIFSRLTLIVTATKIEPLQAISHEDATAEGASGDNGPGTTHGFMSIWRTLHGAASWDANPEVVALTFRVINANIDAPEAKAA